VGLSIILDNTGIPGTLDSVQISSELKQRVVEEIVDVRNDLKDVQNNVKDVKESREKSALFFGIRPYSYFVCVVIRPYRKSEKVGSKRLHRQNC
jgi:hypothetical protein